jgi:hypothetical protein
LQVKKNRNDPNRINKIFVQIPETMIFFLVALHEEFEKVQNYYMKPGIKIRYLLKTSKNRKASLKYIKQFYPGNHTTRKYKGHFSTIYYTGWENTYFNTPITSDPDEIWFVNKIFDGVV